MKRVYVVRRAAAGPALSKLRAQLFDKLFPSSAERGVVNVSRVGEIDGPIFQVGKDADEVLYGSVTARKLSRWGGEEPNGRSDP